MKSKSLINSVLGLSTLFIKNNKSVLKRDYTDKPVTFIVP